MKAITTVYRIIAMASKDLKHMTQDVADMLADENVYYMMW